MHNEIVMVICCIAGLGRRLNYSCAEGYLFIMGWDMVALCIMYKTSMRGPGTGRLKMTVCQIKEVSVTLEGNAHNIHIWKPQTEETARLLWCVKIVFKSSWYKTAPTWHESKRPDVMRVFSDVPCCRCWCSQDDMASDRHPPFHIIGRFCCVINAN